MNYNYNYNKNYNNPCTQWCGGAAERQRANVPTGTSHKSQSGNNGQRHKMF